MNDFNDLGWVDLTLLALLVVSVLIGLARGLLFELMSLVGWVVAYVAAQAYSPRLSAYLPIGAPGSALQLGAAFVLVFVGVLVAWALLARLIRLGLHATPLTLIDRLLGAGFGLLRGTVLLLAVATAVAFTPALRSPPWRDSYAAAWLNLALLGLKPHLPVEVARHLPV
jgi:membrane protein required for colicin V production